MAEIELCHYIHDLPWLQYVVQEERNIFNWLLCIFSADTVKRDGPIEWVGERVLENLS